MAKIKHISSGTVYVVSADPVWSPIGGPRGLWVCGDQNFTDETGTAFEVVELNPVEPTPEPVLDMRVTRLAFMNRMTLQERVAIRAAAAGGEHVISDFLELLAAATFVDLGRSDTKGAIEYLRVKTLLTSPRAAAILNDPIQDAERPAV